MPRTDRIRIYSFYGISPLLILHKVYHLLTGPLHFNIELRSLYRFLIKSRFNLLTWNHDGWVFRAD